MKIENKFELQIIKQALIEMPENAENNNAQLSAPVNVTRKHLLKRLETIPDLY